MCEREGRITEAREVDHIVPVHQDGTDDEANLQAICIACHRAKSLRELPQIQAAVIPTLTRPPLIPVTVVCGPPGAGKSTYVEAHAGADDRVLDLDVIRAHLSGLPMRTAGPEWLVPALRYRNTALGLLADPSTAARYDRAWLIVQAPTYSERRRWAEMLRADVVVLAVDAELCRERTEGRPGPGPDWPRLIDEWWRRYSSGRDETVLTNWVRV